MSSYLGTFWAVWEKGLCKGFRQSRSPRSLCEISLENIYKIILRDKFFLVPRKMFPWQRSTLFRRNFIFLRLKMFSRVVFLFVTWLLILCAFFPDIFHSITSFINIEFSFILLVFSLLFFNSPFITHRCDIASLLVVPHCFKFLFRTHECVANIFQEYWSTSTFCSKAWIQR